MIRWLARLLPTVTVLIAGDEREVIEVYFNDDTAFARAAELRRSGVGDITRASRLLITPSPVRSWGPKWKKAVGWTR